MTPCRIGVMELEVVQRNGMKHTILFDDADQDLVSQYTWCVSQARDNLWYATTASRRPDGRPTSLRMHVLLTGELGVDHINHNGLDNRRANLRSASVAQNQGNRLPRAGTSSQYKGVYRNRRLGKWAAQITVEQRGIHLGLFADEMDAAKAYDSAALQAFGEFALLNFPEMAAV